MCSNKDRVRLVMLFALRFEMESSRIKGLLDCLVQCGVRDNNPALYTAAEGLLRYAGAER
jgi:vacuolar protein sorting-associated protein 45